MLSTRHTFITALFLGSMLAGCGGGGASADSAGSGDTSAQSSSVSSAGGDSSSDRPASVDASNLPAKRVSSAFWVIGRDSRGAASVTAGQVFKRGAVSSGQALAAFVDGQRVPSQIDRKATWPDGSLRHAVVTVRLPGKTVASDPVVDLRPVNKGATGTPVTIRQLLATPFDATVTLEAQGKTYTASARSLLTRAQQRGQCRAWGRQCKHWLSGPLASEWIVGGPVAANGKGESSHLAVYFHVRAYADGSGAVDRVRVDSVIENDWAYAQNPSNQNYEASITVGDQHFKTRQLEHYRQARWHKVLWYNGAPKAYARLDTRYLQATGAVSNYADLSPGQDFLDNRPSGFAPLKKGNQTSHMGQTGAQPAIGPLPRWTSTYVVSGARGAFRWMLANDDAVGSYSFHYRDRKTGRPLRITDHPYVTLADLSHARRSGNRNYQRDLLPACDSDCGSPYAFDIPHHPSIGYVSYLVTGDYYYLEEMQFTASYIELWGNPAYRQYAKGRLRRAQPQTRGQAWSLRSIADAAFATPDDDPMKPYFEHQIDAILADYTRHYADNPDATALHIITGDNGRSSYTIHGEKRTGNSPWQMDFFTWAVGHAAEQGFDHAQHLLHWLAHFQIDMMTNAENKPETGYCWLVASGYALQVRPSQGAPLYDTLDAAYKHTYPSLYGLRCNSQAYVNQLGAIRNKSYQLGQMFGYAHSTTGFPANLQIGLAMAADTNLKNADKAWRKFQSRSIKPDYRYYPNFAVVPRR